MKKSSKNEKKSSKKKNCKIVADKWFCEKFIRDCFEFFGKNSSMNNSMFYKNVCDFIFSFKNKDLLFDIVKKYSKNEKVFNYMYFIAKCNEYKYHDITAYITEKYIEYNKLLKLEKLSDITSKIFDINLPDCIKDKFKHEEFKHSYLVGYNDFEYIDELQSIINNGTLEDFKKFIIDKDLYNWKYDKKYENLTFSSLPSELLDFTYSKGREDIVDFLIKEKIRPSNYMLNEMNKNNKQDIIKYWLDNKIVNEKQIKKVNSLFNK